MRTYDTMYKRNIVIKRLVLLFMAHVNILMKKSVNTYMYHALFKPVWSRFTQVVTQSIICGYDLYLIHPLTLHQGLKKAV